MAKDASRIPIKRFLIERAEDGLTRLTVRTTRYNSLGYPIVDKEVVDEVFATPAAARAHAKKHFDAEPGQFAAK
jgi:hypothetical protein